MAELNKKDVIEITENISVLVLLHLKHFVPFWVQILFDGLAFETYVAQSQRGVGV